MALPKLNNENIQQHLSEIKADPQKKQEAIDGCKSDLRNYVKNHFSFTSDQEKGLDEMKDAVLKELGTGIYLALENDWELKISYIEDGGVEKSCWTSQQFETGWTEQTGYYTKKTVTITFPAG
ncbi:hypothetical protein ISS37_07680 [candidate division KSB1 bacterium]|nr:hypothetical protein [candidate division KSB1 bacterium]